MVDDLTVKVLNKLLDSGPAGVIACIAVLALFFVWRTWRKEVNGRLALFEGQFLGYLKGNEETQKTISIVLQQLQQNFSHFQNRQDEMATNLARIEGQIGRRD